MSFSAFAYTIWDAIKAVWSHIKRFALAVLQFFRDLVGWFKNSYRLNKLREQQRYKAVVLKDVSKQISDRLNDPSKVAVVRCLFDTVTDQIDEENTEILEAGTLDPETERHFQGKEMIVLT